jgi:hypothetical protein
MGVVYGFNSFIIGGEKMKKKIEKRIKEMFKTEDEKIIDYYFLEENEEDNFYLIRVITYKPESHIVYSTYLHNSRSSDMLITDKVEVL